MLPHRSGTALHVVAFWLRWGRICRGGRTALSASGAGSASSPFSLHKVAPASCRCGCLSPTPTPLRHPAFAGPPPRHRFAHGWGRRWVSASGPVRPCAARRPCRAGTVAISCPFGRISESPADHGPPVAPIVLACGCARSSRRAAMVSPWGELRPWRAVVGGVGGGAIARAASDGPTARHLPPVSCGKRRAHDAPGKLRRGPRAAATGVLLPAFAAGCWNWPAAKEKL